MILSASRLKLYRECRLRFYQKYVQHLPDGKNTALIMGSAIHKAIEDHYKGIDWRYTLRHTIASINNEYEDSKGDVIRYNTLAEIYDMSEQYLSNFPFDEFTDSLRELHFNLEYVSRAGNKHGIQGYIDMISDDTLIDFKTGSKKPSSIDDDIQFTIYTWAFLRLYGKKPERVIWYHIRTGDVVEYDLSKFESNWLTVESIITSLENDKFDNVSPCTRCPRWCNAAELLDRHGR